MEGQEPPPLLLPGEPPPQQHYSLFNSSTPFSHHLPESQIYSSANGLIESLESSSQNNVSENMAPTSYGGINSGSSKNKRRIARSRKSTSVPRFEFQTRSEEDILDDGYRWRKYGQKSVKNSNFPRSYYRCSHHTCSVKKQVQRLSKDTSIVVTTYEGIHNHPCEKLMETLLNQLQLQLLTNSGF